MVEKIKKGEFYTCNKCNCELVAVKNPSGCDEKCNLTCCGELMRKAECCK